MLAVKLSMYYLGMLLSFLCECWTVEKFEEIYDLSTSVATRSRLKPVVFRVNFDTLSIFV